MIRKKTDVAIIGGGPAGLAAAISAKENGARKVIIIDRNNWIGGILPQCIHDGFGVEEMGKSLTGPEYAEVYKRLASKKNIEVMKETMVLSFDRKHQIIASNKKELWKINAKAIVLATGCREKTRWHAMIPGTRPSGIYTAGVAQAFINLYNIMPGKRVIILGSGDVGLIIARRLTLEGAIVIAVVEILPYATGLQRNVVQCLNDYNIPLFLGHTIIDINGKDRLESVIISKVDKNGKSIPETNKLVKCDTLILSLGLIPENELTIKAGIKIDRNTGGPLVNQNFETQFSNVFACGNCLHVYDTVDLLSFDARKAGKKAAEKSLSQKKKDTKKNSIWIVPKDGIKYVVPHRIDRYGKIEMTLRSKYVFKSAILCMKIGEEEFFKKKLRYVHPANMIRVEVEIPNDLPLNSKIEVLLNEL